MSNFKESNENIGDEDYLDFTIFLSDFILKSENLFFEMSEQVFINITGTGVEIVQ